MTSLPHPTDDRLRIVRDEPEPLYRPDVRATCRPICVTPDDIKGIARDAVARLELEAFHAGFVTTMLTAALSNAAADLQRRSPGITSDLMRLSLEELAEKKAPRMALGRLREKGEKR